ncbi:hypothetical protein AB0J86_09555 [Micromonospora sp. NPDC049559]|uniref:hypothetical protein n=1 Tax=Micromonospora sp. NPDC049559 TaxID=3155923 RepID=UPI00342E3C67
MSHRHAASGAPPRHDRHAGVSGGRVAGPDDRVPEAEPTTAALLRLQRQAGNAATGRLLSGRPAVVRPDVVVQRDIDDETALSQVESLPEVVRGGGAVPLATETQRREFLRAGREWFGSNEATLAHFAAIERCAAPGGPYLHRDAKVRLEAAIASLGGPAPSTTVAFAFRRAFSDQTHYGGASMHTLGYAIDYDAINMPRIGRGETAELLRLVGGGPSNAQLGEYSARRAVIRAAGDATEAGEPPSAAATALFDQIRSESQRLATASQAFQASLGANRDRFFELRTRYFEATTDADRAAVLAEVPPVIQPWFDAIGAEEQRLRNSATAAGLDPAALPPRAQLTARITRIEQAAHAATAALRAARGREPAANSPLWQRLDRWEQQAGLPASPATPSPATTPAAGQPAAPDAAPPAAFAERVTRLAEHAQRATEALRPLVGAREIVDRLASLRTKLGQPAFLFGAAQRRRGQRPTTQAVADTPSMAQLLDRGFFNPRDPAAGREHFNAEFMVAMAQHGFDVGMAWGGESTDTMHMELVVSRPG